MGDFVSRQRNTQVSLCVLHVCLGQLSVVNQGLCCVGVHMVWRYTHVRVRLCVLCVFVCAWVCKCVHDSLVHRFLHYPEQKFRYLQQLLSAYSC